MDREGILSRTGRCPDTYQRKNPDGSWTLVEPDNCEHDHCTSDAHGRNTAVPSSNVRDPAADDGEDDQRSISQAAADAPAFRSSSSPETSTVDIPTFVPDVPSIVEAPIGNIPSSGPWLSLPRARDSHISSGSTIMVRTPQQPLLPRTSSPGTPLTTFEEPPPASTYASSTITRSAITPSATSNSRPILPKSSSDHAGVFSALASSVPDPASPFGISSSALPPSFSGTQGGTSSVSAAAIRSRASKLPALRPAPRRD